MTNIFFIIIINHRIQDIRREDSGRYACTARNEAGQATDIAYINVQQGEQVYEGNVLGESDIERF